MKIDADNPVPKYLQLKHILRDYLSRQYQAGQKIPTEVELVNQFRVSRNTVRQAISELEQEGILSKEQGRGTFFLGTAAAEQEHDALIGVITPLSSYIYSQILQGISEVALQRHYHIVLGTAGETHEKEFISLERLLKKKIDGLIFEPSGGFTQVQESKSLELLKDVPIPVVLMGWALDEFGVSYVCLDDIEAGFRATSYLINAGHTRIAYVYPYDHLPALQRYQGYTHALETHGIVPDARLDRSGISNQWEQPGYIYTLTKELLELEDDRPTAIFFFNDSAALRGYVAIREAGLKIPDDISVMGFDDFEFAALAEVPLTTVIHPKEQLGKWAAEILFDEIEHRGQRTPRQMIIKPTIAIRDSVKFLI